MHEGDPGPAGTPAPAGGLAGEGLARAALEALLAGGRRVRIRTSGTSMEPLLREGDAVLVERVMAGDLKVGDLVGFWRQDRVIVHRFSGRTTHAGVPMLVERGDNAAGWGLFLPEALLGRVTDLETRGGARDLSGWKERLGGRLLGWRSWLGFHPMAGLRRAWGRLRI